MNTTAEIVPRPHPQNPCRLEDAESSGGPRSNYPPAQAWRSQCARGEELTLRENQGVKVALEMAKLSTINTLAGFDFSFVRALA
jgi:hypothetical protein